MNKAIDDSMNPQVSGYTPNRLSQELDDHETRLNVQEFADAIRPLLTEMQDPVKKQQDKAERDARAKDIRKRLPK
jgi:hypothetical protein